jgi:cell division cycle 2-like protein
LHRARIAHRDLKTSNVLLSNRGEIQIADLGLSADALSCDRQFPNTLLYRAPELLFEAQQSPSYLQDLWALGCVFVEFCSGTPLFARVKSTA